MGLAGNTVCGIRCLCGFGIGNTVQANSVADVLESNFGINKWVTSVALVLLVGAVLIGGIRRISDVAGKLVPFMTVGYFGAGLVVLALNISEIPAAFSSLLRQPLHRWRHRADLRGDRLGGYPFRGGARRILQRGGSGQCADSACCRENPEPDPSGTDRHARYLY